MTVDIDALNLVRGILFVLDGMVGLIGNIYKMRAMVLEHKGKERGNKS